jgi:hypothetical protein
VAGWGEDPILEALRTLVVAGWEVVTVDEDFDGPEGPADRVVVRNGGEGAEEREFVSDHLAFHRYVAGLQGETY